MATSATQTRAGHTSEHRKIGRTLLIEIAVGVTLLFLAWTLFGPK